MKVAVASEDGVAISRHFGRSACFIIFDLDGTEIKSREVRDNNFTAHAQGECSGEEEHHEHHHSHSAIVQALADCEAVICLGMGWRAAQDLESNGIKPYVLPVEMTPEEAVAALAGGRLQTGAQFCRCHE